MTQRCDKQGAEGEDMGVRLLDLRPLALLNNERSNIGLICQLVQVAGYPGLPEQGQGLGDRPLVIDDVLWPTLSALFLLGKHASANVCAKRHPCRQFLQLRAFLLGQPQCHGDGFSATRGSFRCL